MLVAQLLGKDAKGSLTADKNGNIQDPVNNIVNSSGYSAEFVSKRKEVGQRNNGNQSTKMILRVGGESPNLLHCLVTFLIPLMHNSKCKCTRCCLS